MSLFHENLEFVEILKTERIVNRIVNYGNNNFLCKYHYYFID